MRRDTAGAKLKYGAGFLKLEADRVPFRGREGTKGTLEADAHLTVSMCSLCSESHTFSRGANTSISGGRCVY